METESRGQKGKRDNRQTGRQAECSSDARQVGNNSDAGRFPEVLFLMHPTRAHIDAVFENCQEEEW